MRYLVFVVLLLLRFQCSIEMFGKTSKARQGKRKGFGEIQRKVLLPARDRTKSLAIILIPLLYVCVFVCVRTRARV